MADIIGLGCSHFPGPMVPVEYWPTMLQRWVEIGRVSPELFAAREKWPEGMRQEWGNDNGQAAARRHRDRLLAGYRGLRQELDAFRPDIVLFWGDDQYENFKRDCVPPFAVGIFDKVVCKPYQGNEVVFKTDQNAWGLPPDTEMTVRGHFEASLALTRSLLEGEFDIAYALEFRHPRGLAHSFNNTIVYLDYDRRGFDYPVIPFHVNCYGNELLKTSAAATGEGANLLMPPSPSPARCFALGRAVARFFAASPWRVALVGTSSWSHGSLTAKHGRLYPDLAADRRRHEELRSGNFSHWGEITQKEIETSGQQEVLNWIALAGAMTELGLNAKVVDFVESYIFNSSKCFAAFLPRSARTGQAAQ